MMKMLVKNPSSRLAKAVGEALWALGNDEEIVELVDSVDEEALRPGSAKRRSGRRWGLGG